MYPGPHRKVSAFCGLLLALLAAPAAAVLPLYTGRDSTTRPAPGTALEPVVPDKAQCPWNDVMRCSSLFKVSTTADRYVDPATVARRADHYPNGLPAGQKAVARVQTGLGGDYDGGTYTVSFEGTGTVAVGGDAATASGTGTFSTTVTPGSAGIEVSIMASSSTDPVRAISVYPTAAGRTGFHAGWLALAREFSTIYTAHWQREWHNTYSKVLHRWHNRTLPTAQTQALETGVSHEEIAALAAAAAVDVWAVVPWNADAEYVQGMAALYRARLPNGSRLVLSDSTHYGHLKDEATIKARVAHHKMIHAALVAAFGASAVGPGRRVQLVLSCRLVEVCDGQYTRFLDPARDDYDADFRAAVTAVAYEGTVLAGAANYERGVNQFYRTLEGREGQVSQITRERMVWDDLAASGFIGRMALLDLPVMAYDGGVVLGVPMFNHRYRLPNTSTLAIVEGRLEENFRAMERANSANLTALWLEYLERWHRAGGQLVIAGRLVARGIECVEATTRIDGVNRLSCNYLGLTRSVNAAPAANKLRAVRMWRRNNATDAAAIQAAMGNATAPEADPVCNPSCVWGVCTRAGSCRCHAGYKGAACDVFDEALLPNRCSPADYGMNLQGPRDWEPAWMWTNMMNFARYWVHQPSRQVGGRYVWAFNASSKPRPPMHPVTGYPLRLATNEAVATFMRRDTYEYPHGEYHVLYDGDGLLAFGMDTHVLRYERPGHVVVDARPEKQLNNGLYLRIVRTNPDDPIRNIRVVHHSQLAAFRDQGHTFHPLFLQSLERYRVLRFMTAMTVDANLTSNRSLGWSERTTPARYTQVPQGRDGIALEYVVALANELHVRPWLNVPFNADDGFVRGMARLVKQQLNPRLVPVVEYANENWASHHAFGFYMEAEAVKAGLVPDGRDVVKARACWNQHRARQIWRIFAAEGVNVTRVLGGQSVYTRPIEEALACEAGVAAEVDAIAIAPYIGQPLFGPTGPRSLADVFAGADRAINSTADDVRRHAVIAAAANATVFLYEAGPSFFGGARASDPDVITRGLEVHRDSRMASLVSRYFDAMRAAGSTMMMYFVGPASRWGRYGAWGIREAQNQDPATAYKALGYEAYAFNHKQCEATPPTGTAGCNAVSTASRCGGHGFCMRSGQCECYFGWRGATCGERYYVNDTSYCNRYVCEQVRGGQCAPVSHYGSFIALECRGCPAGWGGWDCETPDCSAQANCSWAGRCTAPAKCECYRGATGVDCSHDCGCGGHGTCASGAGPASAAAGTAQCVCDSGYALRNGKCEPTCACSSCLAPGVCGCTERCRFGSCWAGRCECWTGFGGRTCAEKVAATSANRNTTVGINLAGVADWTASTEFTNYMWRSRAWFLQEAGVDRPVTRWTVADPVPLDRDGYPSRLPRDRVAGTFIFRDTKKYIPAGRFHVHYDGEGELDFRFDAREVAGTRAKGYVQVDFTPTEVRDNGFYMVLRRTNPADPLRNIRVLPAAYPHDAYWRRFPIHPAYLKDLAPYRTLRFMDWARLGRVHPGGRQWRLRSSMRRASQATGYGVSEDLMVHLCNLLQADPWFTVPHDADDDYVRQMAVRVKHRLRPDVAVHVEHSNEVWNREFQSYKHALAKGGTAFPQESSFTRRAALWHGRRSQEIFAIWRAVFGPQQRSRLRLKLGTFALGRGVTEAALSQVTARPLEVAVATYFCDESTFGGAAAAPLKTTAQLVSMCDAAVAADETTLEAHVAWVRARNLSVVSYESGVGLVQHSVMFGGYPRPGTQELFHSLHTAPEMANIAGRFLSKYRALGIATQMWFTSAARPSIYGSWGIKDATHTPCDSAPKCRGVAAWMNANRDEAARAVTWGMAEYGLNNSVRVVYAAAPAQAALDAACRRLEARLSVPAFSVNAYVETAASSAAARGVAALSTDAVAYFVSAFSTASQTAGVQGVTMQLLAAVSAESAAAGLPAVSSAGLSLPEGGVIDPHAAVPGQSDASPYDTPQPTATAAPGSSSGALPLCVLLTASVAVLSLFV